KRLAPFAGATRSQDLPRGFLARYARRKFQIATLSIKTTLTSFGRMESAVSVQTGSSSGAFAQAPRPERRGERRTRRRNRKTKNVFSKYLASFSTNYPIHEFSPPPKRNPPPKRGPHCNDGPRVGEEGRAQCGH